MFEKLIKEGIRLEDSGMIHEAISYYKDAALRSPEESIAWELLGDSHWNLRDFKAASEFYRKARDLDPENIDHLESLALTLAYSNQRDEAVIEMANYVKLNPANRTIWYNYGVSLRRIGRPLDAIQALKRAKALESPNVQASTFNALGAAQLEVGMLDDAEESLFSALSLEPQRVIIINNLGKLRWRQGRLKEARAFFERSLSLEPSNVEVIEALSYLDE